MPPAFRCAGRNAALGAVGVGRLNTALAPSIWLAQPQRAYCTARARQSDWATVTLHRMLYQYSLNVRFKDQPPPAVPDSAELGRLEERLGYKFRSTWLLRLAVLHTSAIHKSPAPTLPLLGDSVLQLIIVEQLSAMYPTASAGDLTVAKCKLCSREECRANARAMGLHEVVVLGRSLMGKFGEEGESRPPPDAELWEKNVGALAEAFEAARPVLGAIYLDGGLDRARDVYVRCCPLPDSISELLSWEKKSGAYRAAREATREAARQAGLKAAADAAEDA